MKSVLTIAMMLFFVGGLTACKQDRMKDQQNGTQQQHQGTTDQMQKKDNSGSDSDSSSY